MCSGIAFSDGEHDFSAWLVVTDGTTAYADTTCQAETSKIEVIGHGATIIPSDERTNLLIRSCYNAIADAVYDSTADVISCDTSTIGMSADIGMVDTV